MMFNEYRDCVNQEFFELLQITNISYESIDYDMVCFLLGDGQ
jgi:hypothetical protein